MRGLWALVGAAVAASAVPAVAQTIAGNYPPDAAVPFAQLSAAVTADFRDPQSAQFKGIIVSPRAKGGTIVCGWVNGKNGFGGYAGFVPFIFYAKGSKASVLQDFHDPDYAKLYALLLKDVGCAKSLGL